MNFLSFDIVNFGVPHSLENLVYDFISFKLLSSGYKHMFQVHIELSLPYANGDGEMAQMISNFKKKSFQPFFLFSITL